MGSGSGGSYSGGSGSQPYAPTYNVVSSEFTKDKADRDIYNPTTGYFRNPKASTIENAIQDDRIYMDGKKASGSMTYVIDKDGNIVFGKRYNPNDPSKRAPHPTLIGGKNPEVQCAGMMQFDRGRIVGFDNNSVHFRPNNKSLEAVEKAIDRLRETHPEVISPKYKGGKSR